MQIKTQTAHFKAPADKVLDFVSKVANMPKWSTNFCQGYKKQGEDEMIVCSEMGDVFFRIDACKESGVCDMWGGQTKDQMMRWPARVVDDQNGGSYFTVTCVPAPDTAQEKYDEDCAKMNEELNNLRKLVEAA